MQGALGAIGAISQSISQLGPIAGPIVGGALAIGIAATTAASIKNIKAARSGGGGGGSSAPALSVAAPNIQETPRVNLFGQGNEGSEGDSSQFNSQEQGQPNQIQAVVSWSDIDAVQNNDNNIQQEMQL